MNQIFLLICITIVSIPLAFLLLKLMIWLSFDHGCKVEPLKKKRITQEEMKVLLLDAVGGGKWRFVSGWIDESDQFYCGKISIKIRLPFDLRFYYNDFKHIEVSYQESEQIMNDFLQREDISQFIKEREEDFYWRDEIKKLVEGKL